MHVPEAALATFNGVHPREWLSTETSDEPKPPEGFPARHVSTQPKSSLRIEGQSDEDFPRDATDPFAPHACQFIASQTGASLPVIADNRGPSSCRPVFAARSLS